MHDMTQELAELRAENENLRQQHQDVTQEVETLHAQLAELRAENENLRQQHQEGPAETLRQALRNPEVQSALKRYSARVYVEDLQGVIVAVNSAAAVELGETPEMIRARQWTAREVYGEQYAEAARRLEEQVIHNRMSDPDRLEHCTRPNGGEITAVLTYRVPLFDTNENVSGLVVICHDADPLAGPHARLALRGMRLFHTAGPRPTDGPDEFTYVHDRAGNFLYADPTAQKLFGRGSHGIDGLNVQDIVAPMYRPLMKRNIQEGFENVDATNAFPLCIITAKGEWVWVAVTAYPQEYRGAPCVRGKAVIIDMPGPNHRKTKRAIAGARFGLWDRNLANERIWVNEWLRAMIGLDKRELTFDDLLNAVHPDDREQMLRELKNHIDGITNCYECEYRIWHRKEMRWVSVESRGMVTRNSQEKATHISGSMLDVTARKEAVAAREEAMSYFKRLVDTDQNMIFVKDQEGRFLFINHALEKLYDTTLTEACGRTDADFCPDPEQVAHFRKHDQMVLKGEYLKMPVLECVTGGDKRERWYSTTKVQFTWAGNPAVLGVATEVTDLINERRVNERQRELLESILKSVPNGIHCKDRDGNYTRANQAFLDIVDCTFDELKRKKTIEIFPPEQAVLLEAADQAIFKGQTSIQIDVTLGDKDGRPRVFRITKVPLQNSGKGIAGILSVAQDITDEMEKIERTEKLLSQEQVRFQQITELAQVGIFVADSAGTTRYINPEGRAIELLAPTDPPEQWFKHLALASQKVVLPDWQGFVQRMQGGRTGHEDYKMTQLFDAPDGPRVVRARARAVWDNDETLVGFIGVFTDVTEEEKELNLLRVATASINHNTKNSVYAIRRVLERLKAEMATERSRQLIEAGEVNLKTIEDLAKMARAPDAPRREIEDFNLHAHLKQFALVGDGQQGNDPGRISCLIEPSLPDLVRGPRAVMIQVLLNLVVNATSQENVSTITVEAQGRSVSDEEVQVTLAVEDNGAGLDEQMERKIRRSVSLPDDELIRWIALQTVSAARGRGLPLCEVWLRAINSHLTITTGQNGKCNRFEFTIRVQKCPSSGSVDSPPHVDLSAGGAVLLVDDLPSWRADLAERLLSWGVHTLVACSTGEEAVEQVRKNPSGFGLILADVLLEQGKMDGYKVAQQITALTNEWNHVPKIICISATETNLSRQKEAGFHGHLPKHQIRHPSDLAKILFPDTAAAATSAPAAHEVDPDPNPFDRLPAVIIAEVCRNVALLAWMVQYWGVQDAVTIRALHEWRANKAAQSARDVVAAFEQAAKSHEPALAVGEFLLEILTLAREKKSVW